MTTYLLITSDKPTELTAFVGPKKKRNGYCGGKPFCCEGRRCESLQTHEEIETAKASRLPVVNATIHKPGTIPYLIMVGSDPIQLQFDTPVELEGWEPEIVYQTADSGAFNTDWRTIKEDDFHNNGGYHKRQAYRLKRSEPVKMDHSLDALKYSTFGIPNASPIEAKTQESQEDLFHELFGRLYDTLERGNGTMENIKKEFILTRRNP